MARDVTSPECKYNISTMKSLKKDKHGWIRILESIIAIMIILGFFISLIAKQQEKPSISEEIYTIERQILKEASENDTIREAVLYNDTCTISQFVYPRIPTSLAFNVSICGVFSPCELYPPVDADVYADDILISSTFTQPFPPAPLMLRLFVWQGLAVMPECIVAGPIGEAHGCGYNGCGDVTGENCMNCPEDCCLICVPLLEGKITFVGGYPQQSEGKIKFRANNPGGVSGDFKIRVIEQNGNEIDSDVIPAAAANGIADISPVLPILPHETMGWPSSGSAIIIVYNNNCQATYVVP